MRIIIEGWKDEPLVLEDVKQFVLATEDITKVVASEIFFGYVISRLQTDFAKFIEE